MQNKSIQLLLSNNKRGTPGDIVKIQKEDIDNKIIKIKVVMMSRNFFG